jgi:hypothetical protein
MPDTYTKKTKDKRKKNFGCGLKRKEIPNVSEGYLNQLSTAFYTPETLPEK